MHPSLELQCHGKFSGGCGGKEDGIDETDARVFPRVLSGFMMELLGRDILQARPAVELAPVVANEDVTLTCPPIYLSHEYINTTASAWMYGVSSS